MDTPIETFESPASSPTPMYRRPGSLLRMSTSATSPIPSLADRTRSDYMHMMQDSHSRASFHSEHLHQGAMFLEESPDLMMASAFESDEEIHHPHALFNQSTASLQQQQVQRDIDAWNAHFNQANAE